MAKVEVVGGANASSGFDPLPAGRYSVTITKCELEPVKSDPSRNKVSIEADVLNDEYVGRKLFWNLPTSAAGAGITKACLEAADVPYDVNGDDMSYDTEDFLGAQLDVEVEIESYNDKERNRVKGFLPTSM